MSEVVFGLALLGVFLSILFVQGTQVTVTCERDTGRPRCTVELDELLYENTAVYDDPQNVRAVEHKGGKGSISYRVAIKERSGREHEVITYLSEAEARQAEHWFVRGEPRVVIRRERSFGGQVVAIVLGAIGLVMALLVWRVVHRWRRERRRRAESGVPIL